MVERPLSKVLGYRTVWIVIILRELDIMCQLCSFALNKSSLALGQLFLRHIFISVIQLKENRFEPIVLCLSQNVS